MQHVTELVAGMDAHVMAGAREGHAMHLVTLDRKHLLPKVVRQAALPIIVCTPGVFLQDFLEDMDLARPIAMPQHCSRKRPAAMGSQTAATIYDHVHRPSIEDATEAFFDESDAFPPPVPSTGDTTPRQVRAAKQAKP
jgi:hypothetical protein